jgi:hypothetical protein
MWCKKVDENKIFVSGVYEYSPDESEEVLRDVLDVLERFCISDGITLEEWEEIQRDRCEMWKMDSYGEQGNECKGNE